MAPVPHFVKLAHGQLRVWTVGTGPLLLVLPGLLCGPLRRAEQARKMFPDRTVVAIELPGLGGSALSGPFELEASTALMAAWLESFEATADILAFDLAMPMAMTLQDSSQQVGRIAWMESNQVLTWPVSKDRLEPLPLAEDGTHLTRLWSHLRRRDMLGPADTRQARTVGAYLSAEELDEAVLCFGVDTAAYCLHWNYAVDSCRTLHLDDPLARQCGSPDEAVAYLRESQSRLSQEINFAPQERAAGAVTRDYVQVSRGRVHLRRAGTGPRLLLAFLAGAGTSANLEPLLRGLSHARTVVAPDYIGQGDSCRHTAETSVAELARDADEIATALGFSEYDVYGTHTGAGVAIEAAIAFPQRVRRIIIDGISMQDLAERAEHRERYFPLIEPDIWGSHVFKAWQVRWDGGYFWPWYRPEPSSARASRAPGLPLLHDRVIATLRSRTTPAYQAIASYAAKARLPQVTQPGLFVVGPSDTFVTHMDAARDVAPPNIQFHHVPATVWFAGQDPAALQATMRIYDQFLTSVGIAGQQL